MKQSQFFALCLACGVPALADAATFLLTNGATAKEEMCTVTKSGSELIGLEPCSEAMMNAHGMWQLTGSSQLTTLGSNLCLGADGASMGQCDADSAAWEFTESGQLKVKSGLHCLKTAGAAAARDKALHASVVASSTANEAHGAAKALDGNEASYWASKFDETGPVTLTIDMGDAAGIDTAEISWAFVPKAFSLALSTDGVNFETVYSTNTNIAGVTHIDLAGKAATKAKLTLEEANPLTGTLGTHSIYGIRSINLISKGPGMMVADCAEAAKSGDAGDKFFMVAIAEFDPAVGNAYASELSSLESAMASLSATSSELSAAVPQIASCGSSLAGTSLAKVNSALLASSTMHADDAQAVLEQSRSIIIAARSALA